MGPNGARCVTSPMVPATPLISSLGSHLPPSMGKSLYTGPGWGWGSWGWEVGKCRLASLELPAGGGACGGCTPGFESVPAGVGPGESAVLTSSKGSRWKGGRGGDQLGVFHRLLSHVCEGSQRCGRETAQPPRISFFAGSLLSLSRSNAEGA